MELHNLFLEIPESFSKEIIENVLQTEHFRLERIVSRGQSTPAGEWFDQETEEWVVLLSGSARLVFGEGKEACTLRPGDYIHIPAHRRHRVDWTDPNQNTVWLALHYWGSGLNIQQRVKGERCKV